MKRTRYLISVAVVVAALSSLQATTVIPPTFNELVDRAEVIFQGDVTNVKSEWVGEGAQRHIVSYVTFKVEDALKGVPGETYTIRMLGGTVDGETMEVSDAPKFKVGDKEILFVENNGSQFVPLVGIMHGRFHVRRDPAGRDTIVTNEGEALRSVANIGKEPGAMPAGSPLTNADFKAAIQNRLRQSQ